MTPRFCESCGKPLVAGASFCGGCGHAVGGPAPAPVTLPAAPAPTPVVPPRNPAAPPPTPVGPGAPSAAPFAPAPLQPARRRVGGIVLLGVLAVLVMLGVGTGTAYLLTRDDDAPDRASDRNPRQDDDPAAAATTPADERDEGGDPTATVTVTEGTTGTDGSDDPPADPETALRDVIAADAATADGLVGYWVPQLASISGDINGSWAAALAEYERLKGFFPDLVLVDAADWPHAFVPSQTYDDVLVVLSPTPASLTSAPVLDWCQLNRGDRQTSCYAKLIETSGSPRDNADQNRPEPEFN